MLLRMISIHLQDILTLLDERFIGIVDMTLMGQLVEDVEDTCLCPHL